MPTTISAPDRSRPDAPAAAVEVVDLHVAYGDVTALEGVHASVAPGAALALIGPNGAGKSTLLRALLGLAPVVRGKVRVLGLDPAAARSQVAYVPQEGSLDPQFPVSVRQVVLMGRYRQIGWLRRPGRADRAAAEAALEAVGLAHLAERRFGVLSGGQRQRVLLARAIAQQARILLLDEPFNGMDAAAEEQMVEVFGRLRSEGVTIVLSTHDLGLAHLTCDSACLLHRHQVALGPVEDVLTPEHLREAYGPAAVQFASFATFASDADSDADAARAASTAGTSVTPGRHRRHAHHDHADTR